GTMVVLFSSFGAQSRGGKPHSAPVSTTATAAGATSRSGPSHLSHPVALPAPWSLDPRGGPQRHAMCRHGGGLPPLLRGAGMHRTAKGGDRCTTSSWLPLWDRLRERPPAAGAGAAAGRRAAVIMSRTTAAPRTGPRTAPTRPCRPTMAGGSTRPPRAPPWQAGPRRGGREAPPGGALGGQPPAGGGRPRGGGGGGGRGGGGGPGGGALPPTSARDVGGGGEVYIEGTPMKSPSAPRFFPPPPLEPGLDYFYRVRVVAPGP